MSSNIGIDTTITTSRRPCRCCCVYNRDATGNTIDAITIAITIISIATIFFFAAAVVDVGAVEQTPDLT